MILVDDREGSKELCDLIEDSVVVRLSYGDCCFAGNGPEGVINVGIERKKIGDLINSIATGRLSGHQLPGLLSEYEKTYVIVEGEWREHKGTGAIEVHKFGKQWKDWDKGRRTWSWEAVWKYITTLEMCGVTVRTTRDLGETARMVETLEKWWGKEWGQHKGHMTMHKGTGIVSLNVKKPTVVRRIAAELPGIGIDRAIKVEEKFKTVEEMIMASKEEWMEVEGIGRITARMCYNLIHFGEV